MTTRAVHRIVAVPLLLFISVFPALAAELGDRVTVNGFGGWAAGDTDGNEYLAGEEGREYDSATFALAVTADVSDRLTISSQIHSEIVDEETETELEFAFAEWAFQDSFRLRGGIVKQPFGIYTEIFDVGTARPFYDLPRGMYGPSEFVAEAYRGLGLTGFVPMGDWELAYDVYGGEIELDSTEASNPLLFGVDDDDEFESLEAVKDTLGGRLTFSRGTDLSFGFSAYAGQPEEEEEEEGEGEEEETSTHEVFGFHVQYMPGNWELRAEYIHREGGDEEVEVEAYYVEAARRLGANWQLAARWDFADYDQEGEVLLETLGDHEDLAIGINYWFSSNFVIKLSLHDVEGNLFATADELDELEESTRLIQLGLNFSF